MAFDHDCAFEFYYDESDGAFLAEARRGKQRNLYTFLINYHEHFNLVVAVKYI